MPAELRLVDDVDPAIEMFTLVNRWAAYLRTTRRLRENTVVQYRRAVIRFLGDVLKPLPAITIDDVDEWLEEQDPHGGGGMQVMKAMRSLCTYAVDRGVIEEDPTRLVQIRRVARRTTVPDLSPRELEELFAAAEAIDPRARPALELMYATGARLSSLVAVMPSDVDLERDWIEFRVAKNGDSYGVPLGERGRRAAARLLELVDYTPRTVVSRAPTLLGVRHQTIRDWCRKAGDSAGIAGAHPHLLRHCFGTELAERVHSEADLRSWCALMNHKDASQFIRYSRKRDPNLRGMVADL